MIAPIEIRQQSFKKGIRGFDTDEVKAFLSSLADEWQDLVEQNGKLKYDLEHCGEQLDSYKEKEAMLGKILEQTESSSQKVLESARKEAEIVKREADQKAYQMLQDAYKERSRLEQEINDLNGRRNDILVQLKSFLSSQTERIETFKTQEAVRLPKIEPPKAPKDWVQEYDVADEPEQPASSTPSPEAAATETPCATGRTLPQSKRPKKSRPRPRKSARTSSNRRNRPSSTVRWPIRNPMISTT